MAPIRRKRNVESSEEQVTNNEEQLQLDLVSENQEEKSETSNAVENHVEVYVGFLRKKLKSIGSNVQIVALRRMGYHLEVIS